MRQSRKGSEKQRDKERKKKSKRKRGKEKSSRTEKEREIKKDKRKAACACMCVYTCADPKKQCSCSPHAVSAAEPIHMPCNGRGGAWKGVMVSDVEARGGWQTECKMRREKARDTPAHEGE